MRWTTWEFAMSQNILTAPQWLAAELGLTTSPQWCFEISNVLSLFVWFSVQLAKNHFSGSWCWYPPNKDTHLRLQHSAWDAWDILLSFFCTVVRYSTEGRDRWSILSKVCLWWFPCSVAAQLLANVLRFTSLTWCEKCVSMQVWQCSSLCVQGKKNYCQSVECVFVYLFGPVPVGITFCTSSPNAVCLQPVGDRGWRCLCGLLSCYRSSGWSKALLLSSVLLLANGLRLITSSSRSPASVISGTAKQQSKSLVLTWFTWTAGRRKRGSSAACCWFII